jgi:hypothetical protein
MLISAKVVLIIHNSSNQSLLQSSRSYAKTNHHHNTAYLNNNHVPDREIFHCAVLKQLSRYLGRYSKQEIQDLQAKDALVISYVLALQVLSPSVGAFALHTHQARACNPSLYHQLG